ncbi:MAG: hypothetical protein KAX78_01620, partial [Phycisphaerae bacterium]|nr:hypothetical protein [Phycisphaerae bacterium]
MQPKQEFKPLCEYIAALPVFSDHEHHLSDEFFTHPVTLDVLINSSCVRWTGFGCDGSVEARRALLANVRYNSYFVWFQKGVQQLHGIEEPICLDNWDAVSAKIAQRYATDPQFHWRSLKEAGYERMILDTYWDPGEDDGHPELFVPTFRIDKFMYGFHGESVAPDDFAVWARYGFEGGSMDEFVENMRGIIRERFEQGKVAAFKCAEAYNRHINFQPD